MRRKGSLGTLGIAAQQGLQYLRRGLAAPYLLDRGDQPIERLVGFDIGRSSTGGGEQELEPAEDEAGLRQE